MKKKNAGLLIGLFLAIGVSSEAALLAYEGFDYSPGTLSGQDGGSGWGSPWGSGDKYTVVTNSLEMPNLPFSTTGGSVVGNSNVNRTFHGIDFSQEGTYFISFIAKRTGWGSGGSGEWFDFHFRTTGNTDLAMAGISSTEKFEARVPPASTRSAGNAASEDPYFLVAKLVTHSNAVDELYVKGYSTTNTVDLSEPSGWMVTASPTNLDLAVGQITLWAGTAAPYQAAIDEIRIGETWEDVVPDENSSDLIAYEGFDYSVGSLTGKGGSVDGWTGNWRSSSNYNVVASSLSMPNLPFTPVGGSIIGHDTANRNFTGIDLSTDAVYYASFIMQRTGWGAADGGGEWFDFHFRTTGYAKATQAGISSSEKFEARIFPASMHSDGDAATTEPYFIVTKIVAHASGDDEIYLKAYSTSDTIDLSEVSGWTVVGGVTNCDLFANMVTLWAGKDDDGDGLYQAAIDEIRIGKTWESVVPSTVLLPATIISLKPFGSNTLEMVLNVPNPSVSYPKSINDLVFGSWTNVGHSIDGNVPFVETNLTYSTPSGQNKVIYVKADEATKFYKVDTGK